jgi:hypothetical protein
MTDYTRVVKLQVNPISRAAELQISGIFNEKCRKAAED